MAAVMRLRPAAMCVPPLATILRPPCRPRGFGFRGKARTMLPVPLPLRNLYLSTEVLIDWGLAHPASGIRDEAQYRAAAFNPKRSWLARAVTANVSRIR